MTIEVTDFSYIDDTMERDLAVVLSLLDDLMEATGERIDPEDESVLAAIRADQNSRMFARGAVTDNPRDEQDDGLG